MPRRLAIASVVSFFVWACPAMAQSVVIRWAPGGDSQTAEVVTRLHGELVAMGIEVAVQGESGSEQRHEPPSLDGMSHPDAVMDVTTKADQLLVHIWTRIDAGDLRPWNELAESSSSPNASEKVAIRAAEALRSRFVQDDFRLSSPEARPETQVEERPAVAPAGNDETTVPATHAHVSQRPRFGLGGAVVAPTRGTGPSIMPLARFEWPIVHGLVPQLTLAGLGTRSEVSTANGGVRVSWNYAVVGANYYLAHLGVFEPFVGLSTGVLLSTVEGTAQEPFEEHVSTEMFWLTEVSLGGLVSVSPTFFFTASGHTHFTQPSMAIHVADEVAAVSGRPNWVGTLTLGARL